MKRSMKFLRRLAAILLCLLLFGGCTSKNGGPEVYLDESNPNIVISLFCQGSNLSDFIKDCCKEMTSSGDGSTMILYSDSADYYAEDGLSYRELLLKRLESGQADDLYIIPAEDVLEFDQHGYIYDLSQCRCLDNLSEDALQQSIYQDKVFSVPLSYSCFGLIWNVDLLRRYGLEVPKNLNEFWSVCETLKVNGILPYGANRDFGLSVPAMCAGLGPLYQDPDTERLLAQLSSGEKAISSYMRPGFEFLQTMINHEYLDAEQALNTLPNSDEEASLFAEEKCAFISSLCRAKSFQDTYPFEMQMTALPVLETGAVCVVGADQRLAVNPNSEHLEEALIVVENLCTADTLNEFASKLGKISSAKGNLAATLPQADPLISCVAQGGQVPNQDFSLNFNTWNTIKELSVKLCQGATVDEVCREYDALQQKEIAEYHA